MRNGLSSLRRVALIPRQARNDGGVSNYRTTLRRFALIPRQARNDGGVSNLPHYLAAGRLDSSTGSE